MNKRSASEPKWVTPVAAVILLCCATVFVFAVCSEKKNGGGGPPILGPDHGGWKNQHCEFCHSLPVDGHSVAQPWECAACHGGNGACDPNGSASGRQSHSNADDCVSCHNGYHGFDQSLGCASCHFAAVGRDNCGAAVADAGVDPDGSTPDGGSGDGGTGPNLSHNLTHNCFDWPATSFSPTNRAGVTTSLSAGAPAVEFTLKDLNSVEHTLSELLVTRPVLLVFGAFT